VARILILIGSHLCTAPRPQKEAAALAAAGHEVTVAGGWRDGRFASWDQLAAADAPYRFVPVADLRPGLPAARLRRLVARLRGYLARRRFARRGVFAPELLGPFARTQLRLARAFGADLTIVHAEGGLWAADRLRQCGRRVGVDFEDWFSHDLLPGDRVHRPVAVLEQLETVLLRSCPYTVTASRCLAEALADSCQAPAPAVVYNTFPEAPRDGRWSDRIDPAVPSLHWFSQTIGPGRGLEQLCQALARVRHPCQVFLRGDLPARYQDWWARIAPPARPSPVRLLALVPNGELASRIAGHDIGFSLEEPLCANRELTAGNKLFQYLQAGLAVITTDTRGQREVAARAPAACAVVPSADPAPLAAAIDGLLADPGKLAAAKAAARRAYETVFSWEAQRRVILDRAAAALAASPPCARSPSRST